MRIATKINAALVCAFACGIGATYWVLETTIHTRFDEIEYQAARANHKRITDAFNSFTEKLQTAVQDYAFWDQTYQFLQADGGKDYIETQLEPATTTLSSLGVNALMFLKTDATIAWGQAIDLYSKEPIEGLVDEVAAFSRLHVDLGGSEAKSSRGLIMTSKGLTLVAIAPALRSSHEGPPVGKVISAKLLDVEAAKTLTSLSFNIANLAQSPQALSLQEDIEISIRENEIETSSRLNDLAGKPIAKLNVLSSRDISTAGHMAIESAMIMMLLVGLLSLGILWLFLSHMVSARIVALQKHFTTAGVSGKIAQTVVEKSADEIGDLARSFNGMADQVNHLRDALADSAYMTGLSEWAAGTLHNVRNGLAPVIASTWQVNQLFDKDWIKNIEKAVTEHAEEATHPDRRQKLNSFLTMSAARFAEAAKSTSELTSKIDNASKAVLDMVSEFESYSNRKVEIEPTDLRDLIASVTSVTLQASPSAAEIVQPSKTAVVLGNRVILYQVLSNVLINAIEATKSTHRRGRIEFSIDADGLDNSFTRIEIKDNGEGIAGTRLTEIFRRGVSTRSGRIGGVGLHWCANAVKVLGGTIRAESDGPGFGATLVIRVPTHMAAVKEAA